MDTHPKNILLINFGQIGDLILSLAAMHALRKHFRDSRLTLAVGKSSKAIVEMCELADEIVAVDRVAMRDSNPVWSVTEIVKLVLQIRRSRYDFVIDIHSLPETNILGFLSGARKRLYAKRNTRSLDYLSNFRPEPPEYEDEVHMAEFYAQCLGPLGIDAPSAPYFLTPAQEDLETVDKLFRENGLNEKKLIGINYGAGGPTRLSGLESFGELAKGILESGEYEVVVFSGPEEAGLREIFYDHFPTEVVLMDRLTLKELAAAFSKLELLIGNDSGPIHLAASVGASIVLIIGSNGLDTFIPLSDRLRVVEADDLYAFDTEAVRKAMDSLIANKWQKSD